MEHLEFRTMDMELAAKRDAFRREHERDLAKLLKSNTNARQALWNYAGQLWKAARRESRHAESTALPESSVAPE